MPPKNHPRKKQRSAQVVPRGPNPFGVLPDDILRFIASFCSLQDITSLICAAKSMKGYQMKASDLMLSNMLKHLSPEITYVNLAGCSQISDTGLQAISNLKNLAFLDLSMCSRITQSGFKKLLKCERLQHLNLSALKHLPDILSSLCKFPTLSSLNLDHWQHGSTCRFEDDEVVEDVDDNEEKQSDGEEDDDEDDKKDAKVDAELLIHLSFKKKNAKEGLQDDHLKELAKCSTLTTLSLVNCRALTDDGIKKLDKLVNLERLNLSLCWRITGVSLETMSKFKSLHSLQLHFCPKVDDASLKNLAALKNLTEFSLAFCPLIKDSGVKHLSKLTKLKKCDLSGCSITMKSVEALSQTMVTHTVV